MDPDPTPVAVDALSTHPAETPRKPRLIAPLWHTILLVVLFLVLSWSGADSQHLFVEKYGRILLYGMTIVFEWLMVAYVFWGVRKRGITLRELTGGRWAHPA